MTDPITSVKQHGKNRNRIGLDIGSSYIKMVEISGDPASPVLTSFGFKNVFGMSRQEASDSLKEIFSQSGAVISGGINISLSGPSLIVRFIVMPNMDKDTLRNAIKFEAEKYIPFDVNDCIIDFQILSKDEKDKKLNVLFVAVKKDFVKDKIRLVEDAGFTVGLVDADNFAITNSFIRNFPAPEKGKTFAVLNIGATTTNLAIVRDGVLCFVRDMAVGGNNINAEIIKKLAIEKKAAEEIKLDPKDKLVDVISCAKVVISGLFDEVKMSFGYYENQTGKSVDEVYLTGGSSSILGLAEIFQDTFGANLSSWDPMAFLSMGQGIDIKKLKELKHYFAVATGLALR